MTQLYHDGAYTQSTPSPTTETPTHPCLLMHYLVLQENEASIHVQQQKRMWFIHNGILASC